MKIITSIKSLPAARLPRVFIPTMGALHKGHLSLVETAHKILAQDNIEAEIILSIFVNHLQMDSPAQNEKYPRNLEADIEFLQNSKVDFVFAPKAAEIYPQADNFKLLPPSYFAELEGEFRPQHFSGVALVVLILFNIVKPQIAVFGEKDYQQLLLIKDLVKLLHLNIEIWPVKTLREDDGLALSSRNRFLSNDGRRLALNIFKELEIAKNKYLKGDAKNEIEKQAIASLKSMGIEVDYFQIRNSKNLKTAITNQNNLCILVSATVEGTRLIDNLQFQFTPDH